MSEPIKTFVEFERSLAEASPPAVAPVLVALWWAGKGEWDRAHVAVQDLESPDAAWVHAHLHRQEGDLDNAQYWYQRAARSRPDVALDAEWRAIATQLLEISEVGS